MTWDESKVEGAYKLLFTPWTNLPHPVTCQLTWRKEGNRYYQAPTDWQVFSHMLSHSILISISCKIKHYFHFAEASKLLNPWSVNLLLTGGRRIGIQVCLTAKLNLWWSLPELRLTISHTLLYLDQGVQIWGLAFALNLVWAIWSMQFGYANTNTDIHTHISIYTHVYAHMYIFVTKTKQKLHTYSFVYI